MIGTRMVLRDPDVNDDGDSPGLPSEFPRGAAWGSKSAAGIVGAIDLLERSHRVLVGCLESYGDESFGEPLPTRHGTTAANFFCVMSMYGLYHAARSEPVAPSSGRGCETACVGSRVRIAGRTQP